MKDGSEKTFHEFVFDSYEGYINSINLQKGDFGKQWILGMEDEGKQVFLTFDHKSRYIMSFLERLPNIELGDVVEIQPYSVHDNKSGKDNIGVVVLQNGEKIPSFYREYDEKGDLVKFVNDMPNSGGNQLDDDEWTELRIKIMRFHVNYIKSTIIPILKELYPVDNVDLSADAQSEHDGGVTEEHSEQSVMDMGSEKDEPKRLEPEDPDDDLPF